jgi:CelD/BcsL family acetyltransferase involved in cellulose biosynthesis
MTRLAGRVERGPIAELFCDWDRLHGASPGATPFQSARWARAWWPHWAAGAQPYLVAVREEGRLVGLAPLVRRRRAGVRLLEPVGIEPGDYWDVLAEPGRAADVAATVAGTLHARSRDWDALMLRTVPPASAFPGALDRFRVRIGVHRPVRAPAIELPDSFDAYLAALPSSRRKDLRRHLRQIDRDVELHEVTDPERLPAFVARWRELRRMQWDYQGREIDPEHLSDRMAAFMVDCLRELVPVGLALAWEYRRDGEVVGAYVNYADREAFYSYLGGFEPALRGMGLGKVTVGHGIRTSIEQGRRRFDFTRGPEAYKYWFGSKDRILTSGVAGNGRPRSRAVLAGAQGAVAVRDRRATGGEA